MSRKKGMVFVIMGAVLMLSALLLFLYNRMEDAKAQREAEEALRLLQEQMAQNDNDADEDNKEILPEPTELPVKEIDGYNYIGYLTIPELGLELPVMDDWDYQRLKKAPCRQFGSTVTDDLVIAAHNYKKHFGQLRELEQGSGVQFTNMDGYIYEYTVTRIEKLDPEAVDYVLNSDSGLVLYTCTYGGENRVAVFCERIQELPFVQEEEQEASTAQ